MPVAPLGLRIASSLMTALFLFAAVVKRDDPEPLRWIAIFVAAAAVSVLSTGGRLPWPFPAAVAAVALPWAALLATGVVGRQPLLGSEEGREMAGLLLVAAWSGVVAATRFLRGRRARRREIRMGRA